MKLNDILNEMDFDKGITIRMEGGKILAGDKRYEPSQLKRLPILPIKGGYGQIKFIEVIYLQIMGQINLNPGKKGFR